MEFCRGYFMATLTSLSPSLSCVDRVHVGLTLSHCTLQNFLNQFVDQATKDKVREASSAAAEQAANTASEMAAKSPRISLNVQLKVG